ncbi:MAG: hypothetical protein P8Y51_06085 [Campylobacterales bacterium]
MTETISKEMEEIRSLIAETVAKRNALKAEMQEWYDRFPNERFEKFKDLIATDGVLSQLDTHYKQLWDFHNAPGKTA